MRPKKGNESECLHCIVAFHLEAEVQGCLILWAFAVKSSHIQPHTPSNPISKLYNRSGHTAPPLEL